MSVPPSQLRRRRASRRPVGQSLTEYAIIVFLLAVGTIGVVGLFGNNLRALFSASADALAGETAVASGATRTTPGLTKWSMKGRGGLKGLGSGGTTNSPNPGGNPGGTSNSPPPPGGGFGGLGGNPGGVSNSTMPPGGLGP